MKKELGYTRLLIIAIAAEVIHYLSLYAGIFGASGFFVSKALNLLTFIVVVLGLLRFVGNVRQKQVNGLQYFWLIIGILLLYWSYNQLFGLLV